MSAHKNFFHTSDFIVYTLLFLSGLLEWLLPSELGIDLSISQVVGVMMLLSSWLLIFTAKYQFKMHGQKSGPRNKTTTLIQSGLFKYSRNPIYLGVIFIIPAIGFIVNSLWMLATIIPCFFLVRKILIKPEERYLLTNFSYDYLDYCKKVRRWF